MIILDETEKTVDDDKAGLSADSMEMEFGIRPGERFGIRLILGGATFTEMI